MPVELSLESLADEDPVEITRFRSGAVSVGREPENSIVIDSNSISRRHACIFEAGSQWVFSDLGSANGSWINGISVQAGQLRILRDGDVIQLADCPLKVNEAKGAEQGQDTRDLTASLVVLLGDRFHNELRMADEHARFVIGGPEADLLIDGESTDRPQLVVARFQGKLEATADKVGPPVVINGLAITGATVLGDRDEIQVGPYRILVSDPVTLQYQDQNRDKFAVRPASVGRPVSNVYDRNALPEHLRGNQVDDGWESQGARRRRNTSRKFVFGTAPLDDDNDTTGTVTMDFDSFHTKAGIGGLSGSHRFRLPDAAEEPASSVSDTVIILFGLMIFLAVLGLVVYIWLN